MKYLLILMLVPSLAFGKGSSSSSSRSSSRSSSTSSSRSSSKSSTTTSKSKPSATKTAAKAKKTAIKVAKQKAKATRQKAKVAKQKDKLQVGEKPVPKNVTKPAGPGYYGDGHSMLHWFIVYQMLHHRPAPPSYRSEQPRSCKVKEDCRANEHCWLDHKVCVYQ